MFDIQVTRYKGGINNETDQSIQSDLYVPNRIGKIHEYSQDFDQFVAGDWVATLNGGSAALAAGDGGLLAIATLASAIASIAKTPANYLLALNFRTWALFGLQIDNVLGQVIAGLLNVTATPFTGASQTDGAYFTTSATGEISFNVAVGGVITTVDTGVKLVAGSMATLSLYWDAGVYAAAPNGRVVYQCTGSGVSANARGEIAAPANFPGATLLTPTVGVSASTAAVRTLTVDRVWVAKDRANINATPAF